MTLKIALLLAAFASIVGVAFGYFLRLIISLGKKGSAELKIRQMMLEAKDQVNKITGQAEIKAEDILKEARVEIKEKEREK